jgi:hypothetical protein
MGVTPRETSGNGRDKIRIINGGDDKIDRQ